MVSDGEDGERGRVLLLAGSEVSRCSPRAERAAFEKEGRPVPSICFSIDALYAVVCGGGGHTDTRHIGAGVYESIKTHPRQAPARRGPRG